MTRLLLSSLLLLAACSKQDAEKRDGEAKALNGRCAAGIEPLPARIQRGVSVAHNYQSSGQNGYGSATSAATLAELADLGAKWVSLTPFGFMRSLSEARVHSIEGHSAGETADRMRREIRKAKSLGLEVMLKPHIWVAGGRWRGEIDVGDSAAWNRWFDSYGQWILGYADMAQAAGADILVVGVELRSTERRFGKRWRALIAELRNRFRGELTYSANWDDVENVPWWDALDYIGVQFYPPLATTETVELDRVRSNVAARMDDLAAVAKRHGRPVLLTEVGYRAASDALVRPHAWPERSGQARFDPETQAVAYRALLEAVQGRPWVRGLYWWKWFTDPNTDEEGQAGFSPRGKAAEAVLRAAYGGRCN